MSDRRYRQPLPLGGEDGLPFSKGLMARALIAAGLSADRAYELALAVEGDLAASGRTATTMERLEEVAIETLGEEDGQAAMQRLRRYRDLYELDQPIILLVGGATGTGKSTVATDVAYRLGITRVTSTDFVRQTMRAFFSSEFMPAIHHSSFEAGRAMADEEEDGDVVVGGFLEQTREAWKLEEPLAHLALKWAARLHEIGLDVSHSGYHRHGAYLLENADMPGFPREEQRLLARLVGAHRRKLALDGIEELVPPWDRCAVYLILLLRLAVLLHRGRSATALPEIELSVTPRSVEMRFPARWLKDHPLTSADLQQEVEYLRACGYRLRVFGGAS